MSKYKTFLVAYHEIFLCIFLIQSPLKTDVEGQDEQYAYWIVPRYFFWYIHTFKIKTDLTVSIYWPSNGFFSFLISTYPDEDTGASISEDDDTDYNASLDSGLDEINKFDAETNLEEDQVN